MRKMLLAVLTILLLLFALSGTALADAAPKPSLVVDFKGLEGETYYATLLSEEDASGPWHVYDGPIDWSEPNGAWEAFNSYHDADGFHFIGCFDDCSETQSFRWGYYPPKTFKLLLYFPEQNRLVVSAEIYKRYALENYFTADCTGIGASTTLPRQAVMISYDYGIGLFSLLCRIVLTIAVELLLALQFHFRAKKQLHTILFTNLATQVLLNLLLNLTVYHWGWRLLVVAYLMLELLVILAEALVYRKLLPRYAAQQEQKCHPWCYALTANGLSFAAGLLLTGCLPRLF